MQAYFQYALNLTIATALIWRYRRTSATAWFLAALVVQPVVYEAVYRWWIPAYPFDASLDLESNPISLAIRLKFNHLVPAVLLLAGVLAWSRPRTHLWLERQILIVLAGAGAAFLVLWLECSLGVAAAAHHTAWTRSRLDASPVSDVETWSMVFSGLATFVVVTLQIVASVLVARRIEQPRARAAFIGAWAMLAIRSALVFWKVEWSFAEPLRTVLRYAPEVLFLAGVLFHHPSAPDANERREPRPMLLSVLGWLLVVFAIWGLAGAVFLAPPSNVDPERTRLFWMAAVGSTLYGLLSAGLLMGLRGVGPILIALLSVTVLNQVRHNLIQDGGGGGVMPALLLLFAVFALTRSDVRDSSFSTNRWPRPRGFVLVPMALIGLLIAFLFGTERGEQEGFWWRMRLLDRPIMAQEYRKRWPDGPHAESTVEWEERRAGHRRSSGQ